MSEETNRLTDENEEFPDEPILPEGVDRAEMRRVNGMSRLFDFVEMLVLTVVAVLLISSFLVRHTLVQGGSMNNTLQNGQHLLISDVNYVPKNGDIVVFVPLNVANRSTPFIKRVIAVEGQTVEIRSGVVLVDGVALQNEYYVSSNNRDDYPADYLRDYPEEGYVTVPEGCVFVLGDNRANSHDSREIDVGMVDVRSILGKVVTRVWPISLAGRVE
ncbi:MAG: signal peptidase I [Clostridia bacterium]|nr:signal peptidase I [Clostridia bacterium]